MIEESEGRQVFSLRMGMVIVWRLIGLSVRGDVVL
jgi:hypothetical protein